MSTDIHDRIKSFLIGIALPSLMAIRAIPYLTGKETKTPRGWHSLNPTQSIGWGLLLIGMALCTHALGFRAYDNHPIVKYAMLATGVVAFIVGLCLEF